MVSDNFKSEDGESLVRLMQATRDCRMRSDKPHDRPGISFKFPQYKVA